ncbi:MAG: ATP-binding protein [Chitinophagales bacterium]
MQQLKTQLSAFDSPIEQTIERTWSHLDWSEYSEALVEGASLLSNKMMAIGDFSLEELTAALEKDVEEPEVLLPFYVIHFLWANQAKQFLILWRDVFFEQQKAQVLFVDGKVTEGDMVQLKMQSKETVVRAFEGLKAYFDKEIQRIQLSNGGSEKQISRWKLQANPWHTYREQLELLPKQTKALWEQGAKLEAVADHFFDIRNFVNHAVSLCEKEIGRIKYTAHETTTYITENIEHKAGKVAIYLEDVESNVKIQSHNKAFSSGLEGKLESLVGKVQVYVGTSEGLLQFKDINFQKSVRQWLDSEILPLLYEVWELTEAVRNGIKMSLLNIRNRAILLSNEEKEGKTFDGKKEDISQPLSAFLKKTIAWEQDLFELDTLIKERLKERLNVTEVYGKEDFLPIGLQSTINQLKINQNEWLIKAQTWFEEQVGTVRQFKTSIEREKSLSISEKIVRYVQSHMPDSNNHQYSSIFLTKGYIGESFWVGRKAELQHVKSLVEQWKLGFRGSVILSGQRFSGKSLFGELVVNQYFSDKAIRLSPNSTINIKGRKFHAKYDLGEALEFIKNYTINDLPLVWIDDLELWANPTISLSQNVRDLRKYIDTCSGRIFFVVSMSNWLKTHLDKIYEIGKVFQAEINLDRMGVEDIREAILIRHGATHKILVDKDGKEITPQRFKKMTNSIYKDVEGNVGDALNQWSFSTQKVDAERVMHEYMPPYSLPNFLNPDTTILLAAIMIEKRTNEYRLRKLFGAPFNEKYSSIVQRLISVGILTRHLDGWLEINEAAANDIGRLLEEEGHLKFHK